LISLMNAHDALIANLEGPLTTRGIPADKPAVIRMRPPLGRELQRMGFRVVTLANNHIMDYGVVGLRDTLSNLRRFGVGWVGAGLNKKEAYRPFILRLNSSRLAIFSLCCVTPPNAAATDLRPGVASLTITSDYRLDPLWLAEEPGIPITPKTSVSPEDIEGLRSLIGQARQQADVIVCVIHWGIGLRPYHSILPEYQLELAKELTRMGCHLVVGTHPHVLQPIKIFDRSVVALSLGNFIFHNEQMLKLMSPYGGLLSVKISHRRISEVKLHPLSLDGAGNPSMVETGKLQGLLEQMGVYVEIPSGIKRLEEGGLVIQP
jgi:poly-gamma-glutamate capsule biosynthesis protein CapA/YwtB (metallophosphatase superfamily)